MLWDLAQRLAVARGRWNIGRGTEAGGAWALLRFAPVKPSASQVRVVVQGMTGRRALCRHCFWRAARGQELGRQSKYPQQGTWMTIGIDETQTNFRGHANRHSPTVKLEGEML